MKIAHFHQHIPTMDDNKRIIEYIRETSNDIEDADGNRISASQMLERFLFPTRAHGTPIGKLSGGERKRLHLLKLLNGTTKCSSIWMSRRMIWILKHYRFWRSLLKRFLALSLRFHMIDFFLDRTSTKLWVLDGTGKVDTWLGSYSDYLETYVARKK